MQSIPQGILTCTRSISIQIPSLALVKEYLQKEEKLNSLKNYLHLLKY